MTNLKEINFGLNQYCGPAVLSALTGESTDRCAAVISAVSGKREIKAVNREHLKEALKRLRFTVSETLFGGQTLYGTLFRMISSPGLYVVCVPHHVVAVEVIDEQIYICDNHCKTPLDIKQSARLMQKVECVWKVERKSASVFVRSSIRLFNGVNRVEIYRDNIYEDEEDNTQNYLGAMNWENDEELAKIVRELIFLQLGVK